MTEPAVTNTKCSRTCLITLQMPCPCNYTEVPCCDLYNIYLTDSDWNTGATFLYVFDGCFISCLLPAKCVYHVL